MRFAQRAADQRFVGIAERACAPLRVSVHGRPGVGRGTVARVLRRWFCVVESGADLDVHVLAEVVKPEDAGANGAAVVVLNKSDLTTMRGEGPMAAAGTRCSEFSELLGVPVLPMSGLLAVAALDGLEPASWAMLRALAAEPAPAAIPRELVAGVDLFGIALAITALRQGDGPARVRALWRRVSGVDEVVGRLVAVGAPARYRQVLDAVAELEALAVSDPSVAAFLVSDDTVIARMTAALDAVRACGLQPGPSAPLRRAQHWQRYRRSASSSLHRACGADIARGALRLWSAGQVPR